VELGVYINYIYAISEQTMVGNSDTTPCICATIKTDIYHNTQTTKYFLTKFSDLFKGSVSINHDLTVQFLTFYATVIGQCIDTVLREMI